MYDHECSGLSSGDATKVLFTNWVENAVTVTEKLTDGPLVLVGSSLGGWLALLTALNLKDRLLGLGEVRFYIESRYKLLVKHFNLCHQNKKYH